MRMLLDYDSCLWDTEDDPWESGGRRLILGLQGCVCSWARETGGCYHCGMSTAVLPSPEMDDQHRVPVGGIAEIAASLGATSACVYLHGSFFSEVDLPQTVRHAVLEQVTQSGVQRLVVESLPWHLRKDLLLECVNRLQGKDLVVGLGLDISDDYLRWACLRKPGTAKCFRKACALLSAHGVSSLAYVSVKPPFLSEGEAIDVAIDTALYALDSGVTAISLEPVAALPGTVVERMASTGLYIPPWVWSAVAVRDALPSAARVLLGEFYYPPPSHPVRGCSSCKALARASIEHIVQDTAMRGIDSSCHCRDEWTDEVGRLSCATDLRTAVAERKSLVMSTS